MMNFIISIQAFFSNLLKTFEGLIKIVVLSDFSAFGKLKKIEHSNKLLILGNGPSLIHDLENKAESISAYDDVFAVNNFAYTDSFAEVKPRFYCINAPELFRDDVADIYIENSNRLFNDLAKKTTWQLYVFVVSSAKKCKRWKNVIGTNKNIKIIYYNNTAIEGFNFFKYLLWKNTVGLPRPHNVLIPALIIGINLKFSEINILGVDHSWLKELTVNNKNEALLNQKHFYDYETSTHQTMKMAGKGKRKLHEILHKFYLTFQGYHDIEEYAKSNKTLIYNLTPDSYIDAFLRKNMIS